jgi:hypothetical protein
MKDAILPNVASRYGAPMGRPDTVHPGDGDIAKTIEIRRVALDAGGYDNGGAHWGVGKRMYVALVTVENRIGMLFFRATSDKAARERLVNEYPGVPIA